VIFNNGELQDSLALEHLTGAAELFIPFFGGLPNGYLFLLTKSASVEPILRLPHNGHTIVGWSLNAAEVSQEFEIGAPCLEDRLQAARRAQEAGYRVRVRLDPIVPLPGWETMYAAAIGEIFAKTSPERVTIGTLRFEEGFHRNRHAIIGERHPGSRLLREMERMQPMEVPIGKPAGRGRGLSKVSVGKISYPRTTRVEVFRFIIAEIRKHFAGPIALCKETRDVWREVSLDPSRCRCVCQFAEADLGGPARQGSAEPPERRD
jgi:spore photoproduct lyase